jgi:hypothetical protein
MSYTKLFSSIVTSTIWVESPAVCKVWITMLAICDKHGEVHASIPGLAQISGVPLSDVETAINKFLSPDQYSRTPDDEGRRIEPIDGGWLLINHAKYREMASKEESQKAAATRQARYKERERRNEKVTVGNASVTLGNAQVTPGNAEVTQNRDIADADTDALGTPAGAGVQGETASPPPAVPREKASRKSKLPDAEWLASLKSDRAYTGIDIDREHAKAIRWCVEKRKILSRARLLNWLNKCDPAIGGTYAPAPQPARIGQNLMPDPPIRRYAPMPGMGLEDEHLADPVKHFK